MKKVAAKSSFFPEMPRVPQRKRKPSNDLAQSWRDSYAVG